MSTVAVVGPGGVGGTLAVRLALAGHRVVCVAREASATAIVRDGLVVECDGETLRAKPEAVTHLDEGVDLLLITVKAFDLEAALAAVDPSAVARGVAVPLLNGLEHMGPIHAAFGARTAAGSIGRIEAYRRDPVTVVQLSARPLVRLGSDELPPPMLGVVARLLEQAGADVQIERSEQDVLWEKLVRLAPLAAVTAVSTLSLGQIRSDPAWGRRLVDGLAECCAVANRAGVAVSHEAQWGMIESLPADLTTSAARDVAAGRPSELDAIAGAVIREGARHGVACPTLEELLREAASLSRVEDV